MRTNHDHTAFNAASGVPDTRPEATRTPRFHQTLFTVDQLAAAEPALGKGAIRDDLFHRDTNGLAESGAVIMRGRRILLDREKYLIWLARGAKGAA